MRQSFKRRLKTFGLTVLVFIVLLTGYDALTVIHNVLRWEIIKAHSPPVEQKLPIPLETQSPLSPASGLCWLNWNKPKSISASRPTGPIPPPPKRQTTAQREGKRVQEKEAGNPSR